LSLISFQHPSLCLSCTHTLPHAMGQFYGIGTHDQSHLPIVGLGKRSSTGLKSGGFGVKSGENLGAEVRVEL
jgi:hypothetical protein